MPNEVQEQSPQGRQTPAPRHDGIVSAGWLADTSAFGTSDERRLKRAVGASATTVIVYGVLFAIFVFVAERATAVLTQPPPEPLKYVVVLQQPGPGGGGGGSPAPAPPKPIEIPPSKPPQPIPLTPPPPQVAPPPMPVLMTPIVTANAQVAQSTGTSSVSLAQYGGRGSGGGIGSGRGDGVGPGTGGGFGDGMYKAGSGVTWPEAIKEEKPTYTAEAMRLKLQGDVLLDIEILANGTVGNVRVKRSLDRVHGLDEEAMRVARLWLFKPARDKNGKTVPVVAELAIGFTLH